jgi:hypothetical protein
MQIAVQIGDQLVHFFIIGKHLCFGQLVVGFTVEVVFFAGEEACY